MSLIDTDLEQLNAGSNYKFNATKIDKLGASEYTLVTIVVDTSSSVSYYAKQLETCLKSVLKACSKSPRKDNLLLRLVQFNDNIIESHGFKLLNSIQESDYDGILDIGGNTALFNACHESIEATSTYGKQLTSQDFNCNAIVVVITDGENNRGKMTVNNIKKSIEKTKQSENLQSIITILVGVTDDDVNLNTYLKGVYEDCEFSQYISIGKATPGKIAKLADFVSQSISSTSTALANNTASTPLNPAQFKF